MRHPMRLAAICGTVFVVALVLLILAPSDARRASQQIVPLSAQWRDTVSLSRAAESTERTLAAAESTLAARTALAARPVYIAPPDTLSAASIARRDSLTVITGDLGRLLARAENSPLPQSYRALGESVALRDDPRVRALLDSLTDVEREREDFGAGGGVDPIFVALTARATAIGRSIQSIAEARQATLRDSLTQLRPAPVVVPVRAVVDTVGPLQQRDIARAKRDSAVAALDDARRTNASTDRKLREARAKANVAAPPVAILAASIVLGAMVGFAIALLVEASRPRVSDLQEAERVTGARVLAVVQPRVVPPERTRRKADHQLPPLLDPTSDAYRLLASHASVAGPTRATLMVTGDVAAVTATIAANIAAVSANDMRNTLLIDADLVNRPVNSVLRLRSSSALSAVLSGEGELSAASVQAPVGRDRWLDVVPGGPHRRGPITRGEAEALRRAIARAARYYELAIVVAPLERASEIRLGPEVLVCAHQAHTPVAVLRRGVAALRDAGAHIGGIVLWAADAPNLDPPWTIESWFSNSDRREANEELAGTDH